MRRILIIGVAALTLSATAVVAWAGTDQPDDTQSGAVTTYQGQLIDPIVARVMEQVHGVWRWRTHDVADRAHDVADPLRDVVRDRVMDHESDVVRDRVMDHVDVVDEVVDRAHDAAEPPHDVVRDRRMDQEHSPDSRMDQQTDMAQDRPMDRDRATNAGRNHRDD